MLQHVIKSINEIFHLASARSWYSVLPRLDAIIDCRVKKAIVGRLTELITRFWTEYHLLMKISVRDRNVKVNNVHWLSFNPFTADPVKALHFAILV